MPLLEQEMLFQALARQMERRSYGNYCPKDSIDNLTLVDQVLNSPALPTSRFRQSYWPRIRDAEYRFYQVDDFIEFHLPFAEEYVTTTSRLCLEGPDEEPEFFGKHTTCNVTNNGNGSNKSQGCDICDLLALIEAHIPSGHPCKDLTSAIARVGTLDVNVAGTQIKVRGTVREGMVRILVVEGYLQLMDWSLFRRPQEAEDVRRSLVGPGGRAGAGDDYSGAGVEAQLICLHDGEREGFRHCESVEGCWEVAVAA